MNQRLTVGDKSLITLSILILVFLILSAIGAEWCRHDYYCGDTYPQQYRNDCAADGIRVFRDIVYCWFHTYRDDINAFATTILALFTVILAIATRRQAFLTRDALNVAIEHARHTEGSVRAAQLMAESAASVDAPLVLVERWSADFIHADVVGEPDYVRASVRLENFGRSPAFVTFQCLDIQQAYVLPEPPDYSNGFNVPYGQTIIRHERGYDFNFVYLPEIIPELVTKIVNEEVWIWIYGVIVYFDHLGTEWRYGFCARWYPEKPQLRSHDFFSMTGPSSYTYRAYRRKGEDHFTEVAPRRQT